MGRGRGGGGNTDFYMLKKLRDGKFCQKIRQLNENKEFLEYNLPKLTQKEIEFLNSLMFSKKKKKLNLQFLNFSSNAYLSSDCWISEFLQIFNK